MTQQAKILSKRVVSFNVPQTEQEVVRVQVDNLPHFYDQLHQHPEIQVMLIQSGEGTLVAGDYVGRFQTGDVFVLGSGLPHVFRSDPSYYQPHTRRQSKSISLYFNEKYFGKTLWNTNELKSVRELAAASQQGIQYGKETAAHAAFLLAALPESTGMDRVVTFFRLLLLLCNSADRKTLSLQTSLLRLREEGRMNSIIEFTFQESHRRIYIDEVAQRANLSTEAFCRYFKLHTRKSYINFLHEVRVSQACQLLMHPDRTIQEVCFQSGFANVSNFNRIFLKVAGKTPRAFRQQVTFTE
ncbi:MAG: AraC family transcriptional regulator [Cyclobacteriaceae bacterium]|nr:AraC family transcriptional regulator [Cytophagales bacterium]HNP76918.1 AraC family transcriptional regulator [Cyclobacteriaceae bacterium]